MSTDFDKLAARAAPAIFVLLWSTGFIGTKYVINNADPLTYLAIRMAIVVGLMAIIVAIARPAWPNRTEIGHSIIAGILVHGFYLGGTAVAISLSIPAGLSALIPGLQPILTSTIANRWLGERVTPLQWAGLLIGLGGVALILHDRPMTGRRAGAGSLPRCHWSALRWDAVPAALLQQDRLAQRQSGAVRRGDRVLRGRRVPVRGSRGALDDRVRAGAGLARGRAVDRLDRAAVLADPPSAATSVADLFYLVPAVTSVMAYVLFNERLDAVAIAGMVACAAAVFLVNRRACRRHCELRVAPRNDGVRRSQRFDFFAFFFFLAAFFTAFFADFLAFFADFLAAFLAFFFFEATFFTAFLTAFFVFFAAFLTFFTTVVAASAVALAALLTASVRSIRLVVVHSQPPRFEEATTIA